jgi:hypothetical protein
MALRRQRLAAKSPKKIVSGSDTDLKRLDRWEKIGWEVFERKALLIAAARDLQDNGLSNPMKLAATDVFVEKAQSFLTKRGLYLYCFGAFTTVLAVVLMAYAGNHLYSKPVSDILEVSDPGAHVTRSFLAIALLKSITAGGFIAGIVYFLVSLSRAFFHEGTVLFNRRHSLRFGRLFVYLMSDRMTREDLEVVFNWNAEVATAFRDIHPENIAKSPLIKMVETLTSSLTESARALQEINKAYQSVGGSKTEP